MLETDALKEKLEMEIHRFARPPEELSSGDPYLSSFRPCSQSEKSWKYTAVRYSAGYAACDGNVLESAWLFRNTPSRIAA